MIVKNNKRLIISGILLIVSIVCYSIYKILYRIYLIDHLGFGRYNIDWKHFIPVITYALFLILYCFIFCKKKWGNIIFYIGFVLFALTHIYNTIFFNITIYTTVYLDIFIHRISNIFCILIAIVMIITKAKSTKGVSIIGTIIFCVYALITIPNTIYQLIYYLRFFDISRFDIGICSKIIYLFYPITVLIAIFNIWLAEGGYFILKKKTSIIDKNPLEDNLISLKQLYDSGAITEQEYNQMKTKILNKL